MTLESRQKWEGVYGDLDKMAVQQAAAGIAVKVGPYPSGPFEHLHDPEDNQSGTINRSMPSHSHEAVSGSRQVRVQPCLNTQW